nr:recombinase family protein [Pseudomonadota bacterium]
MRVAVYIRVSTLRQVHAQTADQQLQRLQTHLQTKGWSLSQENIFRDDGYSGAILRRPGLDRLRDKVAAADVDVILITDPDRLARNYVHQVLLLEELQRFGGQVEFLDRPMSTDPHDQLLLQIRGAVAEYERSLITERMRRGRLMKLRAGVLLPWTRAPYGYRLNPERPRDPGGVRIDEAQAAVVAEIFAWYLQDGSSLLSVAKHLCDLNIASPNGKPRWGLATLRAILTNPAYIGQVYAGRYHYRPPKVRRSATHPIGHPHNSGVLVPPEQWIAVARIPAIISQQQFDLAREKLAHNQSFARRNNKMNQYLLRALVSCGKCQLACQARRLQPDHRYYICTGKVRSIQRRQEEKCASRFIPAGQVDDLVWQDLCQLLTHPETIAQALARAHGGQWLPQELQARRENLRKGQSSLQHQIERLTEAYLSGVIPLSEYQRRRTELEHSSQALEQQQHRLQDQVASHAEVAGLAASAEDFCRRVQQSLATATFEHKRKLIELLIDRVVVTNEDVEIRYVIPTSPRSEQVRFMHLRSDYIDAPDVVWLGRPHATQHNRGKPDAQTLLGSTLA